MTVSFFHKSREIAQKTALEIVQNTDSLKKTKIFALHFTFFDIYKGNTPLDFQFSQNIAVALMRIPENMRKILQTLPNFAKKERIVFP